MLHITPTVDACEPDDRSTATELTALSSTCGASSPSASPRDGGALMGCKLALRQRGRTLWFRSTQRC
eukprot:5181407-Alexandrium_andersonii.AAC.1